MSRFLTSPGLFRKIWSLLYVSFAKETYNFKEPNSRSHPIAGLNPQESYILTKLYSCKEFHHDISANSGSASQNSRSIPSSRVHCIYFVFLNTQGPQ